MRSSDTRRVPPTSWLLLFCLAGNTLLGRMFHQFLICRNQNIKQLAEKTDETSPEFWDVPGLITLSSTMNQNLPLWKKCSVKQDYDELVGEPSDVSPKAVRVLLIFGG